MIKIALCVSIEASGDRLLAEMIRTLKRREGQKYRLVGVGGPLSQGEGLESIIDPSRLAAHGLIEALAVLPQTWSIINHLKRLCVEADLLLLVDAPEINMRLLRWVKAHHMPQVRATPVVYLAPPQAWAWRPRRAQTIALADEVGCLFNFAAEWMRAHGVRAHYIGHPLVRKRFSSGHVVHRRGRPLRDREERLRIALFPGSRASSVQRALPLALAGLAHFIEVTEQSIIVNVAYTRWVSDEIYTRSIKAASLSLHDEGWKMNMSIVDFSERLRAMTCGSHPSIELVYTSSSSHCLTLQWIDPQTPQVDESSAEVHPALRNAEVALCHAGTSSLEAALAGVPPLTIAPLSWLSHQVIKYLAQVKYCALPNLCLGRRALPELLADRCTPAELSSALIELVADLSQYQATLDELNEQVSPLDNETLEQIIYPYL